MGTDLLPELGVATGAAAASGLRLYGTVAALGLLQHFGVLQLPESLEVLGHPVIIGLATILYVAEFIADKVPLFDSMWDGDPYLHPYSGRRGPRFRAAPRCAGALADGSGAAGRRRGAVGSRALKASARLAANASPEPFSNWGLSFSEELAVVGVLWLAVAHPLAAVVVGIVLIVCAILAAGWIIRALRRLFSRAPAPV